MASQKVVVVCGKDKSHLVEQLFLLEKLLAPDPTCQPPIRLTSLGCDHNEAARGGALTRGELPGAGSWPWLDLSILQVGSGLGRADRLIVPLGESDLFFCLGFGQEKKNLNSRICVQALSTSVHKGGQKPAGSNQAQERGSIFAQV